MLYNPLAIIAAPQGMKGIMTTQFIREHYLVNNLPVVLVMTDARIPLQAWFANKARRCLVQDNAYIHTIQTNSRVQLITADEFQDYCQANNINTDIPLRGIQLSFSLISRRPTSASDIIPFPTRKSADPQQPQGNQPTPRSDFGLRYAAI